MKNIAASLISWNRRNFVLAALVVSLVGFGLITYKANAQTGTDPTTESRTPQQGVTPLDLVQENPVSNPIVLAPTTASFTEGFDSVSFPPAGWAVVNESSPVGLNVPCWNRFTTTPWAPHTGAGHAGANFNCTSGNNTISGWLITPSIDFNNGDTITFWTRKASPDTFPDRLELRLCTTGATCGTTNGDFSSATDVQNYTTVLVSVNPTLTTGVYPTVFTQYTATISGLSGQTTGRAAFRYFVTNGGPAGLNSDIISIDDFEYTPVVCTPVATTTLNYTGAMQTYTVPPGVTSIKVAASGAEGGNDLSSTYGPGKGADITGTIAVTPGQVLKILVGGSGTRNGGGGGTFVTDSTNTPLIIAGGGAGSSTDADNPNKVGQAGTSGGNGPSGGGTGGTGGNGGTAGASLFQSGAGGGLLTDGAPGSSPCNGGQAFISGGAGGTCGGYGDGGFGGGGGGSGSVVGGGGGGYSGGGSGYVNFGGGGGGGSFNSGSNQTNTAGSHSGNGVVVISSACSSPTTTTVTSSSNPAFVGQTVTFTATMDTVPTGGTPTGAVNFLDGGSPIAGCQNVPANGSAQCPISSLSPGNHTITADFVPDAGFDPSSGSMTGNPQVILSCTPPNTTYVDDGWVGTPLGSDPDGAGPATSFGCNAFATVQGGVDGVTNGGNVIVNSGTYNESQVNITKAVTVTGAGAATTIIDAGNATNATQGTVRISLPAAETGSVSFSGFTTMNPAITGGNRYHVVVKQMNPASTITVQNNRMVGSVGGSPADYAFWVYRNRGPVVFYNNTLTNNTSNPILIESPVGSAASTDIHFNTITGNVSTAIFAMTYSGNDVTALQQIRDNSFDCSVASAISINGAFGASSGKYTNLAINGNVFNSVGASKTAITLSNGANVTPALGAIENPVIYGNTVYGTSAAGSNGIRLRGLIVSPSINTNFIVGVENGIWSEVVNSASTTGASIHLNDIVNNTQGMKWDAANADAENNWWGCNAGPGSPGCNPITGTNGAGVDADPWIVLGITASPSTVSPGGTSAVTADMLKNSDGASPVGIMPSPLVAFSATEGTMLPTSASLVSRVANSTFTSTSANSGTACATVHNQTVCTPLIVIAPTTTTVSSSANPSVTGQNVTFTATVVTVPPGGTPNGTVNFLDGATPIAGCQSVAVVLGQAQCSISTLSVGSHVITANYSGSPTTLASSGNITQVVGKADTTTTVTSSLNPAVFGQSVTFTATVSVDPPGAGTPTGTVTFNIDGNLYCQNTPLSGLTATCTLAGLPALPAGTRNVVAVYNGDANFNGSGGTVTPAQVITKAATTIAITGDTPDPTLVGQSYAVTWAVSVTAPGAGTPTGNVTVTDGTGGTCTAAVSAGTCNITSTTIGVKTLVATYSGDANFTGSTSAGVSHTVNLSITGNVKTSPGLVGLAGVTVTLTGTNGSSTTTDASGNYAFVGQYSGNYTITPSGLGKVYDPISRSYANVVANITNADFLAYESNAVPRVLDIPDTLAVPGQSVTVPITLTSQGTEKTVSFSVSYDTNPFAAAPAVACGADAPGCAITVTNTNGKVGVTVVHTGVFTAGTREVATLTFQTIPTNLANTPLTFGDVPTAKGMTNAGGDPLPAVYTDGLIIFAQGIESDITTRNTGDGVVDTTDLAVIRRFVAGTLTPDPTSNEFQRADAAPSSTKGDGQLDATDIVQARRYAAALDPLQSVGGPGQLVAAPMETMAQPIEGEPVRTMRIVSSAGNAGSRVTVPVALDALGDETAASFTVEFDAEKLANPTVALSTGAPEGTTLTANTDEPGRVKVVIDSNTLFTRANGQQFVLLTFDIARDARTGETPLTITGGSISDDRADQLPTLYQNGAVTLWGPTSAGVSVSGRVTTPQGAGLRNATVTITDANGTTHTARTTAFGIYRFDNLTSGAEYLIQVNSNRYRFVSRRVSLTGSLADVDFTAQE